MSDTIFKRPILIYSSFCDFSNNFLKILTKYPELYNSFIRMNIDIDQTTRKRPTLFYKIQEILGRKISKVPTVITQDAEYILSDEDAFKWLEFEINNLTKGTELVGFNPGEMISFSDHYSKFGSTELNDANDQSYKFYIDVDNQKILPDDNYLNTNKSWDSNNKESLNGFLDELESSSQNIDYKLAESERQYFDQNQPVHNKNINFQDSCNQSKVNMNEIDSYSQNRQQPSANKQSINFTDTSFGLSGKLNNHNISQNNSGSTKSKELDNKLLSLQKDREIMDNSLNQRRRI